MENRSYFAIAACIIFFGLGILLDLGIDTDDHLKDYVSRIEQSIHAQEAEVNEILKDTGFIYRNLRGIDLLTLSQQQQDLKSLESLTSKPFNLSIYTHDSLVFWLNNRAFLSKEQIQFLSARPDTNLLVQFPNGYFEVMTRKLRGDLIAFALIPIKKEYSQDSRFLSSNFVTQEYQIPDDVYLKTLPTDFAIKNSDGQTLAWLAASGPAKDKNFLSILFVIYLFGFLALGFAINDIALLLVRRSQPWVGGLFMFGAVILVRWLTIQMDFTHRFKDFETFQAIFTEPFVQGLNSLGELLISITLLLWMMVFFNREFHVKDFQHPLRIVRFLLTLLNYFAIVLGLFMVSYIFKSIIVDSKTVFDFDDVFNLNSQSVLAMIGVVLLLLAFFLFSHRMMVAIFKVELERRWRIGAMLASLIAVLPVLHFSEIDLAPLFFILASVAFLLMLELFVEVRVVTLGWLVGWLMLFSALSAGLLYKYNSDKDFNRRTEYAVELAVYKDSLAEAAILEIERNLTSDTTLVDWNHLANELKSSLIPREEARSVVEYWLSTNKYLLHNYRLSLAGFVSENGKSAFTEQYLNLEQSEQRYNSAIPIGGSLRFLPVQTKDPGYLLRLDLPSEIPMIVFINFQRSFTSPSKVYTELLLEKKYKNLQELDDYDYGIYQDKVLIEERNKSYSKTLVDTLPAIGQTRVLTHTSKRSELLYHGHEGIAIIIGKDLGGYIKPLSLFSYVFTLLAIAVIIFSWLNYFTNALPGTLNFMRTMRLTLRNQFQFWVISVILLSFLGIGFVTVIYFQRSSNEYHQGRLDRKVTSALANVNYEIRSWYRERKEKREPEISSLRSGFITPELARLERERADLDALTLTALIPLISEVHRLDVNIYDLNGNLMTSSEEDIFKRGLVAPKMGAYAYQEIVKLGYERSNQEESIGDLNYLAAYVPLKDLDGNTMAFMGIPYYLRQTELHKEVTDFMSTLLNVYVFLLLIAGGLAIFIANSITKALSELGLSLQRLRLGYNEPIVWKRKDEIGDLVEAYNRAVIKIEESSRLLAQTEREGAWREMAKQVAHEIKNPLTPMKLSIQYLLHAYKSNASDVESLVQRVSATLIEQIEALAQIANEFSNFAKMPKAENSQFSLNQLAASVHGLFANERTDMEISLLLPDKDFIVFADRAHLARVLNNLFKNAIQAVPDERKGVIEMEINQSETNQEMVRIAVKDNGSGISPEIQGKVFTPNFSTKSSGTGLGLAISKSTIESANGTIHFETKLGEGTTFFVELPLVEVKDIDFE